MSRREWRRQHVNFPELRIRDEGREEVKSSMAVPVTSCGENITDLHFQGLPETGSDVGTDVGKMIVRRIEVLVVL